MKRGDILPVVQPGAYGKPRPALVIRSDLFEIHPSVTILPPAGELRDAPLFRARIEPSPANGLQATSEAMVDKMTTIPRTKAGEPFGRLEEEYLKQIERLPALWLGMA